MAVYYICGYTSIYPASVGHLSRPAGDQQICSAAAGWWKGQSEPLVEGIGQHWGRSAVQACSGVTEAA